MGFSALTETVSASWRSRIPCSRQAFPSRSPSACGQPCRSRTCLPRADANARAARGNVDGDVLLGEAGVNLVPRFVLVGERRGQRRDDRVGRRGAAEHDVGLNSPEACSVDADLLSAGCVEALFDEQPARRPAAERRRHDAARMPRAKSGFFLQCLFAIAFPPRKTGTRAPRKPAAVRPPFRYAGCRMMCAIARALIRKAAVIADKAGAGFTQPLHEWDGTKGARCCQRVILGMEYDPFWVARGTGRKRPMA